MNEKVIKEAQNLVDFAFDTSRDSSVPYVTWHHVWALKDALDAVRKCGICGSRVYPHFCSGAESLSNIPKP